MLHVVCHKYESVLKFCYQPTYCHLIQYFLVRAHITKCFMKSSRWFWFELMFKNKHILLVNTLHLHLQSFKWWQQQHSNHGDTNPSVTRKVKEGEQLILFFYCSGSCLGCILNGTLCASQCTHSNACLPPQSEDLWFQFSDICILFLTLVPSNATLWM
jgi:hypothetical protein